MENEKEEAKSIPVRVVNTLPKKAVKDEVLFNKKDKCFYLGIDTEKEGTNGNHLEKDSIRR